MSEEIKKVTRNEGKPEINTAFIFSCPGQEELKSGKLVNGQTGKNLDKVLVFLNRKYPEIFPSTNRYDYRITNSSECVHYQAYDGRTEPTSQEIKKPENISRLKKDIEGYNYVITFGKSADLAARQIKDLPDTKFLYSQHLSFMSLNFSIKTDINGNPIEKGSSDATQKRLEMAAQKILDQIS